MSFSSSRWITAIVLSVAFCLFLALVDIANSFTPPTLRSDAPLPHSWTILAGKAVDGSLEEKTAVEKTKGNVHTPSDSTIKLSRREAVFQTAALTSALFSSRPAKAAVPITEPTRIELSVETDYLIQVLRFFDGDMRKVLGAVVRSPYTKVQIDPPTRDENQARDAILRALYSYDAPDDYVEQAQWLKLQERENSFLKGLTKKRYTFTLSNESNRNEDNTFTTPATISLSNLEAGGVAAVVSYPVAYAVYQYENYREEQEAKAKKAKFAAKKAAAAAKKEGSEKKKKVIKGQAVKKMEEGSNEVPAAPANPKSSPAPSPASTAPSIQPGSVNLRGQEADPSMKGASPTTMEPPPPAAPPVEADQKSSPAPSPASTPQDTSIQAGSVNVRNQKADPSMKGASPTTMEPPPARAPPPVEVTAAARKKMDTMDAYAEQYAAMLAASQQQKSNV